MAYFAPEKASEDAINILNRALSQERALSDFEITKIRKNLDSMQRRGYMAEYHMASSCFFAILGDMQGLIKSSKEVFNSPYATNKDKLQVVFALNNAMRYKDIYNFLPYLCADEFIDDPAYVDCALSAYIINFDFENAKLLSSKLGKEMLCQKDISITIALSEALESFFAKKGNSEDYKGYITSTLDWYSENILGRARNLLGQSSLNYSFYEDETIDFLSVSIEFRRGDLDDLLDLEDELLTYIAKSSYPSYVKSTLNIKMGFKDVEDNEAITETVTVYD